MLRPCAAAALLIAAAGCAAAPGATGPFVYACAEGKTFTARFSPGGDAATIAAGGQVRTLPQAVSASGARFADADGQYWSKGRKATLEGFPGGPYAGCATR